MGLETRQSPRERGRPPRDFEPAGPARPRAPLVAIGVGLLLLLVIAFLVDQSRSDKIANGVRVAGVPVGGMSKQAALNKLESQLPARLDQPVVARYAGHAYRLTARQAGVRADYQGMVAEAVKRSRGGWFGGRAIDAVTGRSLNVEVPASMSYAQPAVDRFVTAVTASIDRAPRDASVTFSGAGPIKVKERTGLAVERDTLRRSVADALTGLGPRSVPVSVHVTQPHVFERELAARYPAAIVVDRASFTLKLYRHLKLAQSYTIAVGQQGLETPAGLYHVQGKEVDPSWHVPMSSWAGSLAGQTIPPGPQDPLKARWIGFDGGAGIHGTADSGSLGTAASHGCIRMAVPDVIALYPQVKVGDPVYVA